MYVFVRKAVYMATFMSARRIRKRFHVAILSNLIFIMFLSLFPLPIKCAHSIWFIYSRLFTCGIFRSTFTISRMDSQTNNRRARERERRRKCIYCILYLLYPLFILFPLSLCVHYVSHCYCRRSDALEK